MTAPRSRTRASRPRVRRRRLGIDLDGIVAHTITPATRGREHEALQALALTDTDRIGTLQWTRWVDDHGTCSTYELTCRWTPPSGSFPISWTATDQATREDLP